ncbi:hypothetical protein MUK42_01745, partial [Musa troglodytarum]
MAEARSLNDIRSALENLEDQLEFFHTVQSQQRAERDAAIARLEQSRIILAMRLAEHRGKKYKVIEEALAFVGDVHNMGRFVTPETLYENEMTRSQSGKNLEDHECKGPSMLMQMFISSFAVAKRSLGLVSVQGILGNAAMFTVSMLALVHLNQVAFKGEAAPARDQAFYRRRNGVRFSRMDDSSHGGQLKRLDVLFYGCMGLNSNLEVDLSAWMMPFPGYCRPSSCLKFREKKLKTLLLRVSCNGMVCASQVQ